MAASKENMAKSKEKIDAKTATFRNLPISKVNKIP